MILLLVLLIILLPLPAFAFGPFAHVDMGLAVLAQASAIGTVAASIIQRHRKAFLRGTVDPDRMLAKNMAPFEHHTHNWDRVLDLLDNASTDEEKAAFMGQLCHLAADVVAHNYFVPTKMTESFYFPMAKHLYWEMRFDSRTRAKGGSLLFDTLQWCDPDHVRFLSTVLKPSVLTGNFNVKVTGKLMDWQQQKAFDTVGNFWDQHARTELSEDDFDDIRNLAIQAQVAALSEVGHGLVYEIDPRGLEPLKRSLFLRREMRELRKDMSWLSIINRIQESRSEFRYPVESAVW